MRVTERGGVKLGGLLSNKNLWSGMLFGRGDCGICKQPGESKEDCIRQNVLYESNCLECVSEGGPATNQERREQGASIYVGETARSLYERSSEHWQAAAMMKEESHMFKHAEESHKGDKLPQFNFKLVRSFKSALDRQIAEAIRIEMRGAVLNRRGEYNRCSLTRLGVDWKWKEEWFKKSLEVLQRTDVESHDLMEPVDNKRPGEKVKTGEPRG